MALHAIYLSPAVSREITQNTRIASMGSCFAREIKDALIQKGYTYIPDIFYFPAFEMVVTYRMVLGKSMFTEHTK
jgi:hypothetical protein